MKDFITYTVLGVLLIIHQFMQAQIPAGYYNDAENTSGNQLKTALNSIIKGHTVFPYSSSSIDVWDIVRHTDEDPNNSNNVILLYTGRSQNKYYVDAGSNYDYSQFDNGNGTYGNSWNREHVWAKSHGFPNEQDHAYTDVHHLRPTDRSVNSSRGNKDFDNSENFHSEATLCKTDGDSWEPRDAVKGDVARMMFYMVVRYENSGTYDLELVNYTGTSSTPIFGKLSTLLTWHSEDPVDDFERNRNEVIYSYQNNRNPFIDHPNLVNHIWGTQQSVPWNSTLSLDSKHFINSNLYPNPTQNGTVTLATKHNFIQATVFSVSGNFISKQPLTGILKTIHLPKNPGVYFVKLTDTNHKQRIQKVAVGF
jgi:endonuclease I